MKLALIPTLAALSAVRVELEVDDGERLVDLLMRR